MAAEELVERVGAGHVQRQARCRAGRRAPTSGAGWPRCPGRSRRSRRPGSPTSMPSSRASVATTASSSPSTSRCSISRRCDRRVAGAVGRDPLGQVGAAAILQAQAGEALDQLHAAARAQEADRAHLLLHQVGQQVGRLAERRRRGRPVRSSTSGGFHIAIRRSARGAPSRSTSAHLAAGQPLGQLHRVGDRGAGQHEPRLGAVGQRQRGAAGAARWPRVSRTRRGRRAPRPPRPRPGWPAGRPTGAWLGSTPTCSMSGLVRIRFERARMARRSSLRRVAVVDRRAQVRAASARAARAPGPGPAPWWGRGRARGPSGRG